MKYGSKQYGVTCSKLIMVFQSFARAFIALLFFILYIILLYINTLVMVIQMKIICHDYSTLN